MMRRLINIVENAQEGVPAILYHQAPPAARERIAKLGLQHPRDIPGDLGIEMSNDETVGIFFTDNPENGPRSDLWEVDVRGLHLVPDDTTDWPEGHTWWVTYQDEVGPERLKLIQKGIG